MSLSNQLSNFLIKLIVSCSDCVGLVSLHELGESTTTYKQMFAANRPFFESFARYKNGRYGFKKHVVLVCVDGAAMGHHVGNSGHAAICGCCFCTRPKELKHGPPSPRPPRCFNLVPSTAGILVLHTVFPAARLKVPPCSQCASGGRSAWLSGRGAGSSAPPS